MSNGDAAGKPFLTDVKTLRDRARQHLEDGPVSATYRGDAKKTVEILQSVLATEIVCVLRYTMHAVTATGLASEGVKSEFSQHAREEQQHMMMVAERINQLGGTPDFNPGLGRECPAGCLLLPDAAGVMLPRSKRGGNA